MGLYWLLLACPATARQMSMAKTKIQEVQPPTLVFCRAGVVALTVGLRYALVCRANLFASVDYWLVTLVRALIGLCVRYLLIFRSYRHWEMSWPSILLTLQPFFAVPIG
jgi:drug/metabolite transporter (DMT)-like permease